VQRRGRDSADSATPHIAQATVVDTPVGYWIIDLATLGMKWSPIACEMHGLNESASPSHYTDFESFLDPDDRERLAAACLAARDTREARYGSYHFPVPGKGARAFAVQIVFLSEAAVCADRLVVTIRDTAQMDEALRGFAEGFVFAQAVADTTPDFIYVIDLATKNVIYNNRSFVEELGYKTDEKPAVKNNFFSDLVHPDERFQYLLTLRNLSHLDDGEASDYSFRFKTADGSWQWYACRATVFDKELGGEVHQVLVIMHNITDLMQTNVRLTESEHRFRELFEHSPVSMALVDSRGRFAEANDALCSFFGRAVSELIGRRYAEFLHPNERTATELEKRRMRSGYTDVRRSERRFVHVDGHHLWGQVSTVLVVEHGEQRVLMCLEDITARKTAEDQLVRAALHDSLTDLPNRRLMRDRLTVALARAARGESLVAVLFIDLDNFKRINDSLGHDVGDELLVAVGHRIQSILRAGDTIARLGGDEFVVVAEEINTEETLHLLAGRVFEAIRAPVLINGREIAITGSVGIAASSKSGPGPDDLLRLADAAMYRAKSDGKDRYLVADDTLRDNVAVQFTTEKELRHAITDDELVLYYQPVIAMNGILLGLEALVRWRHPVRGILDPRDFLHVADASDLSKPLSDWVLQRALADASTWSNPGIQVGVNVSANDLRRPGFATAVAQALNSSGVPPHGLYLEILENHLAESRSIGMRELELLRALGVSVAIDDFGTGYSALSYLKHVPAGTIKIDRSFIRNISADPADAAIVRAIVTVAEATGRRTLAEGVETADQLQILQEIGCDAMQGNLIGQASPLEDLQEVIAAGRIDLTAYVVSDSEKEPELP
jgi:diguanylate cyclase (GGDEF)-like protein/PAS domain S-box-containing protein